MEHKKFDTINKVNDSLSTIAPYVGKMRPELAGFLIEKYASDTGYLYDPFMGSGTVLLEGWKHGFDVIGNDLNYYAYVLSFAKTHPYLDAESALKALEKYKGNIDRKSGNFNTDFVPDWIKEFFDPITLKEICCWTNCFRRNKEWFLMACLLGILHHQRPGFLSYPSSHGAPYLRTNKYPAEDYPDMYQYKNVYEKLTAKISRVYKSMPQLDFDLERRILNKDASKVSYKNLHASTIITSPPYMKSLTYARDNRMRLWFLGIEEWKDLDKSISPAKAPFFELMKSCISRWSKLQMQGDKCVIIIGDIKTNYNNQKVTLGDALVDLSSKKYKFIEAFSDPIPESRKVVKGNSSIKNESIVVLERK